MNEIKHYYDEPPSKQSRVEVGDYNSDDDGHYGEKGFCADDANAMNEDDDDMPMQREQLSLDSTHGDSSEGDLRRALYGEGNFSVHGQ